MPSLMSAADAVDDLRVGTFVLGNDFRPPPIVAQEAMTLHTLTGGRFELGLGTGWLKDDYQELGIELDRGGVRLRRLEAALDVMGRSWDEWAHPRPPLLLAGSGERMLSLAAARADIVSVTATVGVSTRHGFGDAMISAGEGLVERIEWIRRAAGPRFDDLEINVFAHEAAITDDAGSAAAALGGPAERVLASPHVAIGTVGEVVETLERRRAEHGISYVVFSGGAMEEMAPVVGRLAGR